MRAEIHDRVVAERPREQEGFAGAPTGDPVVAAGAGDGQAIDITGDRVGAVVVIVDPFGQPVRLIVDLVVRA
jgi:hypothetical protein